MKRWPFLVAGPMAVGLLWAVLHLPPTLAANVLAVDEVHRALAGEGILSSAQRAALVGYVQAHGASSAWRVLGMVLCGDAAAECEDMYRATLAHYPNDPILLFRLANLLAASGREEEALPLWAQAGAAPYWRALGVAKGGCACTASEGMCDLQRAARIDPTDGLNQYYLGRQLARCEQWKGAVAALSAAINSGLLPSLEQHEAWVNRAIAAYHAGYGIEAAEEDLARAMALQPKNPWPHMHLCTLYLLDGQKDRALEACNVAVDLAPNLGYAYYYRGQVWRMLKEYDRARADYEQALALMPDLEAAKQGLARLP